MELQHKFRVILHREAQVFLKSLDEKTRSKILQTFDRASLLLDPEVFKKLETKPIDTLVIATHGFVKKTQKTPQKEIDKAMSVRELYFSKQLNRKDHE